MMYSVIVSITLLLNQEELFQLQYCWPILLIKQHFFPCVYVYIVSRISRRTCIQRRNGSRNLPISLSLIKFRVERLPRLYRADSIPLHLRCRPRERSGTNGAGGNRSSSKIPARDYAPRAISDLRNSADDACP